MPDEIKNPAWPAGVRLLTDPVASKISTWAVELRDDPDFPIGASAQRIIDGKPYYALANVHDWYGADPSKASAPHRGITVGEIVGPKTPRAEGLDVSHWQGSIDWARVARHRGFAFMKATERLDFVDERFAANWKAAKAAGVLRGAYHFFRPKLDAVGQAKHFLATLGDDPGELAPVLDVETLDGTPYATVADGVRACIDYVAKATGRRPILYTSPSFWAQLPDRGIEALTDLWVAHWTSALEPTMPRGWSKWMFHQWSDKAPIPGVGLTDANRFNGTLADLLAYVRANASAKPNGSTPAPSPKPEPTVSKHSNREIVPNETEADRYCRQIVWVCDGGHTTARLERGTSTSQSTCMVVARSADRETRLLPEDGDKVWTEELPFKRRNGTNYVVDWGDYGKEVAEGDNLIDVGITYPAMKYGAWCAQSSAAYRDGPKRGCVYWIHYPGVGNSEHVVSVLKVTVLEVDKDGKPTKLQLETVQGGQFPAPHVRRYTDTILVWDGKVWRAGKADGKIVNGWAVRSETVLCGEGKWPYPKSRVDVASAPVEQEPIGPRSPVLVDAMTGERETVDTSDDGGTLAPKRIDPRVAFIVAALTGVGALVAWLFRDC